MENFLSAKREEKNYSYEELCQEVSLVLGFSLPASLEEFVTLDKEYIIDICSKYLMDKDSQKSRLVSYINKFFHEHKKPLLLSQNSESSEKRYPPLPWSYSGYYYEIKRALRIKIPTPPHKNKFTKALLQELLGSFHQDDDSYESMIVHHGRFFVSDYTAEELKVLLEEKEILRGRKNKIKKSKSINEGMQQSQIQQQEPIMSTMHTTFESLPTLQEYSLDHTTVVSEIDYKIIALFLKTISSRSSNHAMTTLESGLDVLNDNLGKNTYWKEKLMMYMTHGELDLQKIKNAFISPYYKESAIYTYIMNFKSGK